MEQWLKSVKGEHVVPLLVTDIPQIVANAQLELNSDIKTDVKSEAEVVDRKLEIESKPVVDIIKSGTDSNEEELKIKEDPDKDLETLPVLKISVKDGKQVISQVDDSGNKSPEQPTEKEKSKEKHKSKSKDKTYDKSSSKSSSSSKHSSKSHSSNDKDKSSHKSSSSSRHSSKDKSSRDKEKLSSHSSRSKQNESSNKKSDKTNSSSNKSKDDKNAKLSVDKSKDKNKDEKNKDTSKSSIEKNDDKTTPSIHKLGKIPKLSDAKKEKPSISIEVRKPDEPKPKTVKTFHSKFRKHGLEEEVKPPPSRAALLNKKIPPVLPPTIPVPKRPSPVHSEAPPEKKPKTIEPVEKPGAIKLIPPKPKRKYKCSISKVDLLLIYFIFAGAPSPKLLVLSSSVNYSLKCDYGSGKSKIYNLTGSPLYLLPVKYLLQINVELISIQLFRCIFT